VTRFDGDRGASYGDAWFAGLAAGLVDPETDLVDPETEWTRIGEVVEPDVSVKNAYDERCPMYTDLYTSTRNVMHQIARLQTGAAADP
jgi:xylulokinase